MQVQIVLLEYTLAKAKRALTFYSKNIARETLKEIDAVLKKFKNGVSDVR